MIAPFWLVSVTGYAHGIADQRTNGQVSTTYPTSFEWQPLPCLRTPLDQSFQVASSSISSHPVRASMNMFRRSLIFCASTGAGSELSRAFNPFSMSLKLGFAQFMLIHDNTS
jgi:hypothetical protein